MVGDCSAREPDRGANLTANPVFTIGHSNVPLEGLLSLLEKYDIRVLIDVRSMPYSRYAPQANREVVEAAVKATGRKYLFMGEQLGGQPRDIEIRDGAGNTDYSNLAAAESVQAGLDRILRVAAEYRVCLLCSEEDPSRCHRGLLVGRELAKRGLDVKHIRHDGSVESQGDLEKRLPPVQRSLF